VYISDFRLHQPNTLAEAVGFLESSKDAVLLAGGTDLLVDLKQGKRTHQDVVSLTRIPELREIAVQQGTLTIGACVTVDQLMHSQVIREHCFAISEAATTIATDQIRNVATVGGNLCTAASCADTAPILMVLGADVEIVGSGGQRTLPLAEFMVDHRRTALKNGEILRKVLVPIPTKGTGAAFQKFGLRQAANISVASVAAMVRVANARCEDARFVMGAVAPTPRISATATPLLKGKPLSDISEGSPLADQAGQAVADDAEPIDDLRGSAAFRREITAVLARRALAVALRRAGEGSGGGR
jgi:CO/xanthine dehydrogenase FAD-binding subunit